MSCDPICNATFLVFQVHVKFVTEFHKLNASMSGSCKSVQKIVSEHPRRNHRGLIIHLCVYQ